MPIEFTLSELTGILLGIDMPDGFYDIDALVASIAASIDVDTLGGAIIASTISGPATPEALAAAQARATEQARKIAADLTHAQLNSIAAKVQANIEAGNAFDNLHGLLSEITGLDKNRAATLDKFKQSLIDKGVSGDKLVDKVEAMRAKLLRDRRKTIAQTEQRMATENGAAEIARNRGAQFKRWITAGDDLVSDMDVDNEAQGWIAFDEEFSSGDNQPPSHPNCRCTVTYRVSEPDEFDKRRAEAASDATAAARAE